MAESIYVRTEGGSILEMDLPLPEPIQQRFDAGLIVRVEKDGDPWTGKPEREPAQESEEDRKAREDAEDEKRPIGPVKPAQNASKAQWVDYAELSSDKSHDELQAMTKAELIERFG